MDTSGVEEEEEENGISSSRRRWPGARGYDHQIVTGIVNVVTTWSESNHLTAVALHRHQLRGEGKGQGRDSAIRGFGVDGQTVVVATRTHKSGDRDGVAGPEGLFRGKPSQGETEARSRKGRGFLFCCVVKTGWVGGGEGGCAAFTRARGEREKVPREGKKGVGGEKKVRKSGGEEKRRKG